MLRGACIIGKKRIEDERVSAAQTNNRMIGVAASEADLGIAEEFFELFKTPWQPAVAGCRYKVLLGSDVPVEEFDADVYMLYSPAAGQPARASGADDGPSAVEFGSRSFPVYGALSTFDVPGSGVLHTNRKPVASRSDSSGAVVWRIGYDLFAEVRQLLTHGQPPTLSDCPTLELHIEVLRELLRQSDVDFLEIPPTPDGYDCFCCLTHDVDFFGIRKHKLDRTLAGFIARASVGSLRDLVRGRRTMGEAARNLGALFALPFIFLGVARDFWRPFEDYASVEEGRHSTFFLVPFKQRAGVGPDGRVDPVRAVPYDVTEIRDEARAVAARGSELAVHGVDAWRDADSGLDEKSRLTSVSGQARCGVRMHWLYFNEASPRALEAAGFDYDSTWGYNETVGYRAGTLQAFRFPGTATLLELPLAIMDSALFSGGRMALSAAGAERCYSPLIDDARMFGGALVINWHERSLAPERLWGRAYRSLLDKVTSRNRVCFATAQTAVDWYRWRRSIRFTDDGAVVEVSAPARLDCAGIIRVHRRRGLAGPQDVAFFGGPAVPVQVAARDRQPISNSLS